MSSVISRMIDSLFGRVECRVLLFGLDATGKTTLLYKWKLNEVVTTIPTIGFNVETVTTQNVSITIWDIGGCDKIRPLWRHYFQNTQACIFCIDSNDRSRIEEAADEIERVLSEDEMKNIPMLILANKQDLPAAMSLNEIKDIIGKRAGVQRQANRVSFQGACAVHGIGLPEALEWLRAAAINKSKFVGESESTPKNEEKSVLETWLEREDEPDDDFLTKLDNYTLESWDHYTHLRVAWVLLTRHGRQHGMPLIFEKIKNFIANSSRTQRSRGTTFHETLTYFWVHMVHYAIASTKYPDGQFKTFLLMNPQLSNGGMFLDFYSKTLMLHTPESRVKVVLPDKRPLPSMLSDVSQSPSNPPVTHAVKTYTDDEFLTMFASRTLPSWGHEVLIRVIFVFLTKHGRKGGVKIILDELQKFQGPHFHLTISYFWIQMVHNAIATIKKSSEVNSFAEFKSTNEGQSTIVDSTLYLQFYSTKLIDSPEAVTQMVLPDKKQLPNVI